MRVPQVTDRLKEAPAQALRAVFSGVGSVLLVADRLRHRPGQETGQGNGHAARPTTMSPAATAQAQYGGSPAAQGGPAAKAASPAKASSAKASSAAPPALRTPAAPPTSADSPAPARSGGRPVKATAPAPAKRGSGSVKAAPAPATGGSGTVTGASGSATAALDGAVSGSGAAGGLPMAGYDGLTVPQLRARMRTLEPAQLRALIAYERAHAGRDEVVAMFERRLAKVEGGG